MLGISGESHGKVVALRFEELAVESGRDTLFLR
jgi:hypothetical protein